MKGNFENVLNLVRMELRNYVILHIIPWKTVFFPEMFFRNVHFRKLVKVSWNYIKTLLYVTMIEEEVNHKLPLTLLQRLLVNSL